MVDPTILLKTNMKKNIIRCFNKIILKNYEKSSLHKLAREVKEIIEPLRKIGIVYFSCAEIIDSCYFRGIVSDTYVAKAFIKDDGLQKEISLSPNKILKPGFYPASSLINISKSESIRKYYQERLNISGTSDVIVAIKDEANLRKVYAFGLLNSSYINHEYLEAFIAFFNDKAFNLINKAEIIKIPAKIIESRVEMYSYGNNLIYPSDDIKKELINNITLYKIKKFQEKYLLSPREAECLQLVLQNKLNKEIAYQLGIKKKTIDGEGYIRSLLRKAKCRTKLELILKFFSETPF